MKSSKRNRKPTTVGEMLDKEFLIPLGISHETFAEHLEVEVKTISGLIDEKIPLRPQLALKLASALGTTPEFWMNLQIFNDLWVLKNTDIDLPGGILA